MNTKFINRNSFSFLLQNSSSSMFSEYIIYSHMDYSSIYYLFQFYSSNPSDSSCNSSSFKYSSYELYLVHNNAHSFQRHRPMV